MSRPTGVGIRGALKFGCTSPAVPEKMQPGLVSDRFCKVQDSWNILETFVGLLEALQSSSIYLKDFDRQPKDVKSQRQCGRA